ncbi:MAG: SBBP repeat-containing protein, partial [Bacteroidetes bacterium]|nr:SBBP repeat-containing protein [Bacteroidota bacterium]
MKHAQSTRNSFTLRFTLRILVVMTGLLIPVVVAAQITNPRFDSHFSVESVSGHERADGRWLPPRLRDAVHGTDRQQTTFENFHRTDSVVATWIRQYSSRLVPGDDVAYNIATDKDGNIYVNGYCQNAERGRDYITLKYDSSGTELWRALYNGTGNSEDRAYALAVDTLGNVYVTGASYGSSSLYDFATVKYNRFGVQQWEARYNGPGNSDDRANAIAVDTEGGVYVLGESRGSGTGLDITVVKYNSAGTEEWVTRYNGPGNMNDYGSAIAVDVDRNVYVTGTSTGDGTQFDYATIKYNSTGVEQWLSVYNGPGNAIDDALALYIANGDVYVTGMSVGAGTYNDIATIKYNGAGVQQWVARYNREGYSDDKANAIAVDSNRNVYVTGSSRVSGSFNDYTTIKYDSLGIQQWVALYDGPRGYYDEAYAIAVDTGGNVYVTGYCDGPDTSWDYATIKYNTAGNQQWVVRYSDVSRSDEVANALTVRGNGSVYVTGWSGDDIVTVVYDHTSGAEKMVIRSDGPGNSVDRALAMAIDSSGNAYVAGSSAGPNGFSDYVTIKYRSDGTEDWVARYNGPSDSIDIANAIGVDRQGNVYVTGTSGGVGTSTDIATVKYNSAGVQQWV